MSRALISSLCFLMLLCAPATVQILSPTKSVSAAEKRRLTAPPSLSEAFAEPAKMPARINAFLDDHFGLRDALIGLYFYFNRHLDLNKRQNALRGDDGWLFDNLSRSLEMHQGLLPFVGSEQRAWREGISKLSSSCDAPSVVMISPNKHTVYPEHLSRYPRKLSMPTRRELLMAALAAEGVAVADPLPSLLNAKADRQVYFKTDTHWTSYGGYLGSIALVNTLRGRGLDVAAAASERMVEGTDASFVGDLPALLGETSMTFETAPIWAVRDPAPALGETRLASYDWGGFPARVIRTDVAGPRLLLIGDSFSDYMLPFLRESFSTITLVHHRRGEKFLEGDSKCDFDAVAIAFVERALGDPYMTE
jgi:hypothetical protein